MRMTRRDWLLRTTGAVAGAALVFGLPALRAGAGEEPKEAEPEKRPPWLDDALAEMRRTNAPGVAIVVPAADGSERRDKEREAIRAAVAALLERREYEVRELLVEAVWVCVPGTFVAAGPGETAVLIEASTNGGLKRVAGAAIDFSAPTKFVEGATALLRGEKRLEERAKAARTEEVAREIARLLGTHEEWQDALPRLTESFPKVRAAVIQARIDAKDDEARARLRQVVQSHFHQRTSPAFANPLSHLPFGASWKYELPADAADPCPACGMAAIQDVGRVVLELMTREKKPK